MSKVKADQAVLATLPSVNKKKTDWSAVIFIVSFLSIHIIWFLIYWACVNINSFLLAFQDFNGNFTPQYVLNVLEDIFTKEALTSNLGRCVVNTFIFALRDALFIFFHLGIAYFFYKKITGYRAFQIIFYLPGIISEVALAMAFKHFVGDKGPIVEMLLNSGIIETAPSLLETELDDRGFWTMLFYTIWLGWGGNMLLLGGALARVPLEVVESARLDGVGSGRELVSIILPLVWPTMSTLFLLKLTTMFTASGPALVLMGNNAMNQHAGNIAFYIYYYSVYARDDNMVSAAGLVFTTIGVPLVMFLRWLVEKVPVVEY
ncbi:MAG: sugar ABC transporter permease [Clostridia bacterium]|nr:sugar ABC transporter permease [Clostridia bacterium]